MIKKFFISNFKKLFQEHFDKKLVLNAKKLSIENNKKKKIKDLSEVEFQVFSQWGEDGIIDWLVNKISNISKTFLEIGTEDYKESNTRFLLINKNWDGFIIESDKKSVDKIKSQRVYWKHNLIIKNHFVTKENINDLINNFKVPKNIGILSLDIDGIDFWVLKELKDLNPTIIICEFNPLFGKNKSITVPYKKNFIRKNEHYSNLYFGASIKAFINLLNKKGYFFIGTNSSGNNGFFVKRNFSHSIKKSIKSKNIYIGKFRESRNHKGKLSHLSKTKSLELIKNKLVIDLDNNKLVKIANLKL